MHIHPRRTDEHHSNSMIRSNECIAR